MVEKIMTQDQISAFIETGRKMLVDVCGEDWKKDFLAAKQAKKDGLTKNIEFELPVLANLVMRGLSGMSEHKLTKMIIKKVHAENVEQVHTLLKSYLTQEEIVSYWQSISANSDIKPEVATSFERLLFAA